VRIRRVASRPLVETRPAEVVPEDGVAALERVRFR
jgi:hypothetical protein